MRNWLEYLPLIIIATFVRILPRNMAIKLGRSLGRFASRVQPRRVRIATDNLSNAFPDLTTSERNARIEEMFSQIGTSFIEMLRLDRYQDTGEIERHFHLEGQEHFKDALSHGRGCILLTGHIGFWEAGSIILPYLGHPIGIVAKPMRNPLADAFFRRMREAGGGYIINSQRGARQIVKSLGENHIVGVLMDQHLKGRGSACPPFFGRPAHTTTIIAQIALKNRIPIVPAFAYHRADRDYLVRAEPAFFLEGEATEQNIFDCTAHLNKVLEDGIRHDPTQYFWVHRRWRPCCEA